nr:Chain E, Cleaved fragment of N-terminal expression tag [synthetic construct]5D9G_C Chain C, oligo peptide [Homo sapiens]5D9G_D Chain D, oligo peptide [Homo sapiens]
ENLYFQ